MVFLKKMAYRHIRSATEVAAFTNNIHPAIVDIAPLELLS